MPKNTLIIATRESPLALWQANWVKTQLLAIHPHLHIQLLGLTTKADKMLEVPLAQVGGKGLFVKELEEALINHQADIAVHSMKDVPMELPKGLMLGAFCEREDPRDVFVSNEFASVRDLPSGALVGTSSLRRECQLRALRPDLSVAALRGNVNTRLEKLDRGDFAGIILAAAGLMRLGLSSRIREKISLDDSLPAAGQGILGIECRDNDEQIQTWIASLNDYNTEVCVTAERAMCRKLNGGCHAPVAAWADTQGNKLCLRGLVGREDGRLLLRAQGEETVEASHQNTLFMAERLGTKVANELLAQGAEEILRCQKPKV